MEGQFLIWSLAFFAGIVILQRYLDAKAAKLSYQRELENILNSPEHRVKGRFE